jgi:hypothetical protein
MWHGVAKIKIPTLIKHAGSVDLMYKLYFKTIKFWNYSESNI